MTAAPPRRPWWRKKRTWAALVLLLALGYPASIGPVCYAANRGWISLPAYRAVSVPVFHSLMWIDRDGIPFFNGYVLWWHRLGVRHAASD